MDLVFMVPIFNGHIGFELPNLPISEMEAHGQRAKNGESGGRRASPQPEGKPILNVAWYSVSGAVERARRRAFPGARLQPGLEACAEGGALVKGVSSVAAALLLLLAPAIADASAAFVTSPGAPADPFAPRGLPKVKRMFLEYRSGGMESSLISFPRERDVGRSISAASGLRGCVRYLLCYGRCEHGSCCCVRGACLEWESFTTLILPLL